MRRWSGLHAWNASKFKLGFKRIQTVVIEEGVKQNGSPFVFSFIFCVTTAQFFFGFCYPWGNCKAKKIKVQSCLFWLASWKTFSNGEKGRVACRLNVLTKYLMLDMKVSDTFYTLVQSRVEYHMEKWSVWNIYLSCWYRFRWNVSLLSSF